MTPERLFLERCSQLDALVSSASEIGLLDMGARLRQMVLDERSLVPLVNRNKLKIEFEICVLDLDIYSRIPGLPAPLFMSIEDGIDPYLVAGIRAPCAVVGIDDYLNTVIMIFQGKTIRVKDVIRSASNVAGGVHYSPNPKTTTKPNDTDYVLLQTLSQLFLVNDHPAGLRTLRAITRVFLRGIEPLRRNVLERTQSG